MKKSTGKLLIGLAVGVLLAGGIGAIAYGSDGFTNSDISTWFDGEWRAINFEDQTKEYTGSKIEPDILPDGFTYEITKIEKDGEEVDLETGAVASGDYVFTISITKTEDGEKRDYFVNLTISAENEFPTEVKANNLKIRTLKVQALANGDIVKTLSYSVEPSDADQSLEVISILKNDADASSIVSCSIDSSAKTITLTCKEAFDSQIIVKLRHKVATNVEASIVCDYKKKILSTDFSVFGGWEIFELSDNSIAIDPFGPYDVGGFHSGECVIENYIDCSINWSIGTIEGTPGKSSFKWVSEFDPVPSGGNQTFEEYEFFQTYLDIDEENGTISTKGEMNDWIYLCNVVWKIPDHRFDLGHFTYTDIGGFTHRFDVYLLASQAVINSISLDNSSIVF